MNNKALYACRYGYDAGHTITTASGATLTRSLTRDPYRRGLITAIINTVNGIPANPLTYTYDILNRVTRRNQDTFSYNARSEVTSATIQPSHTNRYEYDNIGNNRWTALNAATTSYTANQLNQYTSIGNGATIEPEYDLDGNLIWDGRFHYTYDAENRLIAVYNGSSLVVSNAYDHQSRRILKITPSETRTFLYDGWNLIQETIATSSSTTTNQYIWGKDLSGTLQGLPAATGTAQAGAGGVGGLLAVNIANSYYFPLYDNNGNITVYVDDTGAVVAEYRYDAFGKTIAQSGAMANTFPHRFSTKYYDTETGLYYYGYRFYSPALMRWLNRDPIGENGGENVYVFVDNAPLDYFDPFGDVRVNKNITQRDDRLTFNGHSIWGWTFDPELKSERNTELQYDKKTCECRVKRKPELTFSIAIWVVKKGRQAWSEDAKIGGVLYPDSRVYVSGALASATLAHENRRFDAWANGLKSYFGREYEDEAASLTAPTCTDLAQKIAELRTATFVQWSFSADFTSVFQKLVQIGSESVMTARIVKDSLWKGVYVEYDLDE